MILRFQRILNPPKKNELKHEEKSSDASGFLERNLKEKLQMFILLMDIHPETKELATHKLQTIDKDESVIGFFQWIHRMAELKRIEEMW